MSLSPWTLLAAILAVPALHADSLDAQLERGAKIYTEKCLMCHQPNGGGAPPVYPPLAGSDWLQADRSRAIRVLCEGLSGPITVKDVRYQNNMPAQVLDDQQAADVLTFVGASWENRMPPFTATEIANARRTSKFPTFQALVKAAEYQPLPKPFPGWKLSEFARLPEFCSRLISNGTPQGIYALGNSGTIFHIDAGAAVPVIRKEEYLSGDLSTMGATFDPQGRLLVVSNRTHRTGEQPFENEVVLWRSTSSQNGHPTGLKPWLVTGYNKGGGKFNHGVSHIAFGPDGKLYVNSGSRTDAGEDSPDPAYLGGGERENTACIWRIDPDTPQPAVEIHARGIRNAYGFAWDADGNLFTVSNGPDYSAPEEMDWIRPGKHYGFPFQFSDWPQKKGFPYPFTPDAPAGVAFTLPLLNLGPAGGGSPQKPMATFDPHSSPCGMVWCGPQYPEPFRNCFLLTRSGNLLGPPACPEDVGFDLLRLKMHRQNPDTWTVETTVIAAPLGRPVDVMAAGGNRLLILEYTRATNFKDNTGWLPGRVLELAPDSP
jgi:glucose/arabinose dehydrogenase/mono/diheme cytochrome c family protein